MKHRHKKTHEMPKELVDELARIGTHLGDEYLALCKAEKVEPVEVGWMQSFEQQKHVVRAHICWPGDQWETVDLPPFLHLADLPGEVVSAVKRGHVMRAGGN